MCVRTQRCAQGLSTFACAQGLSTFACAQGLSTSKVSLCQAYTSDRYCVLLYKDLGLWVGIRIKKGKHIFSFGRGNNLSEKAIRKIADKVMKKLDQGEDADEVRTWARAECAK